MEISKKYPPWIKKNRKTLSAEDLARYEAQLVKVVGIVRAFDEGEKDFAKIVTLLQEMQAFGLPPDEIMHDLSHNKDLPKGPDGKPIIPGAVLGCMPRCRVSVSWRRTMTRWTRPGSCLTPNLSTPWRATSVSCSAGARTHPVVCECA